MRTVVFDIECNGLSPDKVWFIVCRDVDTGEEHVFRPSTGGDNNFEEFLSYANTVDCWVGHHILGYDVPVLERLCPGWSRQDAGLVDTLVVSRLLDTDISGGHSLEAWCERLGVKKAHTDITDWSQPTPEMLERCISDTAGNVLLYKRFKKYLSSPLWAKAIEVEHFIAARCRELHDNGFHFSLDKAKHLWYTIDQQVKELDVEILRAFQPRVHLIREIVPRFTQYGSLNRSDFRWVQDGDLTPFNGGPFSRIEFEPFNPGSPAQIVERLNEAGWKPTEKTKGHIKALREKKNLERKGAWSKEKQERIDKYAVYGYTVSEENLLTLPETAPPAAKTLARRIMLASRLRTLTEWINAYNDNTGRIHGSFHSIGAWTHRMSHVQPNTGNIAREDALYGAEMRSMWSCPDGSYLVGVDAESIQLRVLAHYINDPKFTQSLLTGKKEDGTDPHSLNKIALGPICASRNDAKTFIYAWLLGAGIGKVAQILSCTYGEAAEAVANFIEFYPGLKYVKEVLIPEDAKRGYFQGFDGRWVKIFGEDFSSKKHFTLAGYLQCGEVTVMKHGMQIWYPRLKKEGVPFKIVNFVHDEWQTEVPDYDTGKYVGEVQAEGIRLAGELLNLRCPMAGSVLSGHGGLAIGKTWLETH
jgi:DNA polymerase-1